ncbi:hypothetical protein DFH08DRAFT_808775 [Mycena albidolilacea]|uniref:Uncharacterized protein n=1 Tax=Mycena albidolilacea TaxID=1033008 RepID=A0AAD7A218_9AGAR|nr:hypothetical protein DFH08DRAFT_808775 [Mycena albidolilacea]
MSTKVALARTLTCFNGTKSQWDNFRDQLLMYLGVYNDKLNTNKRQVFFTISHLWSEDNKLCVAVDWAHNWIKGVLVNGVTLPKDDPVTHTGAYTFDHLLAELDAVFKDQNLAQSVHVCLMSTRQGAKSLQEFLQQFELDAELMGYTPNAVNTLYDQFLIELLEDLLNHKISSQVHTGGVQVPNTYKVFKECLVVINSNLGREKLQKNC